MLLLWIPQPRLPQVAPQNAPFPEPKRDTERKEQVRLQAVCKAGSPGWEGFHHGLNLLR